MAPCYTRSMRACTRSAGPNLTATSMRRTAIFVAVVVLVMGIHDGTRPLFAQPTGFAPQRNETTIRFADSMDFALDAEAEPGRRFEDIVLRFEIDDEDVRNRRIPEFQPGSRVQARHTEPLPRGSLHPTAEITWWWTLVDDLGATIETQRRTARYMDEQLPWQSLDGQGLRLWYHDMDLDEARDVLDMSERSFRAVDALVDLREERTIEVVAYQRQADLRRALADRGATYESRLSTLGARVAADTVVLDVGSSADDLEEVIRHELSHIVLHLHLGREWVQVPAWLDEGLAMYAEGPLGRDEQGLLDRALARDELLSARSLTAFPGDAGQVSLAYAESRDLVAFLVEEHESGAFRRMLDNLVEGETGFDEALALEFGYDPLSLYQAYRAARDLPPAVVPSGLDDGDGSRTGSTGAAADRTAAGADDDGTPACNGIGGLLGFVLMAWVGASPRRRAWYRAHQSPDRS